MIIPVKVIKLDDCNGFEVFNQQTLVPVKNANPRQPNVEPHLLQQSSALVAVVCVSGDEEDTAGY